MVCICKINFVGVQGLLIHKSDWSLKLTSGSGTCTPGLEMSIYLCAIFMNRVEFKLLVIHTWVS